MSTMKRLAFSRWSLPTYHAVTALFFISVWPDIGVVGLAFHGAIVAWLLLFPRGWSTALMHCKNLSVNMTTAYIRWIPLCTLLGCIALWAAHQIGRDKGVIPSVLVIGGLISIGLGVSLAGSAIFNFPVTGKSLTPGMSSYCICSMCEHSFRVDDVPGKRGIAFECPSCEASNTLEPLWPK